MPTEAGPQTAARKTRAAKTSARKAPACRPASAKASDAKKRNGKAAAKTPDKAKTAARDKPAAGTPPTGTPPTEEPSTKSAAKSTRRRVAKGKATAKRSTPRDPAAAVQDSHAPKRLGSNGTTDGRRPDNAESGHGCKAEPAAPGQASTTEQGKGPAAAGAAVISETEPHTDAGDGSEAAARANKLVPTNAVHTTERRLKRGLHQNRAIMILAAATVIGLLILADQPEPPDVTPLEQQTSSGSAADTVAPNRLGPWADEALSDPVQATARRGPSFATETADPMQAPDSRGARRPARTAFSFALVELNTEDLIEMEWMLARLDLDPSLPDGVVDDRTKSAIRLYQQIAGLPVNGEPSHSLLADMREVIRILEGGG